MSKCWACWTHFFNDKYLSKLKQLDPFIEPFIFVMCMGMWKVSIFATENGSNEIKLRHGVTIKYRTS